MGGKLMVLPEEIKIGNSKYQITNVNKLLLGNKVCWGLINHTISEIVVLDNLAQREKIQVLWHEIVHGMFGEYNIPIHDIKYEEHEEIVDLLAIAICQVIKDNPELVKLTMENS